MDIKYVIIIPTYYRINKKSSTYLQNSINSILNQTYTNWDLIIVSDKYEPIEELNNIVNNFKQKLNSNNNIILLYNYDVERDFIKNKFNLWHCAGANSVNLGLKYARENGYTHYLHLDDDDWWYPNHIEEINNIYSKYKNCIFVNTKSTYGNNYTLPVENISIYENNLLPKPSGMIHSSFSFRIDIINYNYWTTKNENDNFSPSDAIMLGNIRNFILQNKMYCSIYNPVLTCRHDTEGESRK